ncbi:MAG: matrixin family metalloprotease [Planctomycetota bacterium]
MLRPRTVALASLALLGACQQQPTVTPVDAAATHFAVRGRWPAEPRIRWRAESGPMPVDEATFRDAVARACATWNATGCVTFVPAAAGDDADVTLGWRRGHHGACEPFGISTTVAHSGPVRPGTFVHFDADRSWVADAADDDRAYSLYGTALHELGHVLGLGHSAADDAVMKTGEVRSLPLSPSDRFGLQSLYGGGDDAPGDVRVLRDDGTALATLRGVAPIDRCGLACFDIDGDGRCELVVWRTDRDGDGVIMSYHFDSDGLTRTTGPYFAMASAADGASNGVVTAGGYRLFVTRFGNGRVIARRFDEHGLLVPHSADGLDGPGEQPRSGDVDGDGRAETIVPVVGS